ncbi:MAG: hypothetical protein ACPK85_04535 [Methanosarcina sp.]
MEHGEISLVETAISKVSLVVRLTDNYTSESPIGKMELSLQDHMGYERKPIRIAGGYYIFCNLSQDSYTILVKGDKYYFDKKESVSPSDLENQTPFIKNISLDPAPSYAFSPHATLIRGALLDSQGKGISEAVLEIKGKNENFQITEKGEFAIYFEGLKENEVEKVERKNLVKINGKNPILEVKHPDFGKKTKSVEVEEGKTVSVTITFS